VPVILVRFLRKLNFSTDFRKILKYQNLFQSAQRKPSCSKRPDRHDEAKSPFPQLCERAYKKLHCSATIYKCNSFSCYVLITANVSSNAMGTQTTAVPATYYYAANTPTLQSNTNHTAHLIKKIHFKA
jgi:hypothetical protein